MAKSALLEDCLVIGSAVQVPFSLEPSQITQDIAMAGKTPRNPTAASRNPTTEIKGGAPPKAARAPAAASGAKKVATETPAKTAGGAKAPTAKASKK